MYERDGNKAKRKLFETITTNGTHHPHTLTTNCTEESINQNECSNGNRFKSWQWIAVMMDYLHDLNDNKTCQREQRDHSVYKYPNSIWDTCNSIMWKYLFHLFITCRDLEIFFKPKEETIIFSICSYIYIIFLCYLFFKFVLTLRAFNHDLESFGRPLTVRRHTTGNIGMLQ